MSTIYGYKKEQKIIDWIDNYCNKASYKPKSLIVGISGELTFP